MKPLLALAALLMAAALLVGCSSRPESGPAGVGYWHDDLHGVSCWTFGWYSLSCLPDRWVTP